MTNFAEAWPPADKRNGASSTPPMLTARGGPLSTKPAGADLHRPSAPAERKSSGVTVLDRASKNVLTLLNRYQRLEQHVRDLDAWSAAQIEAAEAAAAQARETTAAAEARLLALQSAFEAMRKRAEAAEQTLDRGNRTLETLQDRIIEAFGFGAQPCGGHVSVAAA